MTIRMTVEAVLTTRVSADKDVSFKMAEMIWKFAQMKAQQKQVELPGMIIETSFDPHRVSDNIRNGLASEKEKSA